jgi:hypothetical protein
MARTERDIEAYLLALGKPHEKVEDGTWLIRLAADSVPVAMRIAGSVVVLRVLIGPPPSDPAAQAALFRKLLELNASELMYSAYGLEQGRIVLGAALELDNLDLNELEAVLADIDLALARHVPRLRELTAG